MDKYIVKHEVHGKTYKRGDPHPYVYSSRANALAAASTYSDGANARIVKLVPKKPAPAGDWQLLGAKETFNGMADDTWTLVVVSGANEVPYITNIKSMRLMMPFPPFTRWMVIPK